MLAGVPVVPAAVPEAGPTAVVSPSALASAPSALVAALGTSNGARSPAALATTTIAAPTLATLSAGPSAVPRASTGPTALTAAVASAAIAVAVAIAATGRLRLRLLSSYLRTLGEPRVLV